MKSLIFEENTENFVRVSAANIKNIYAFKNHHSGDVYILKSIADKFAWITLKSVCGGWNSYHDSMKKAFQSVSDKNVFEFDSYDEFLTWFGSE